MMNQTFAGKVRSALLLPIAIDFYRDSFAFPFDVTFNRHRR
jgi:hypothetical protein